MTAETVPPPARKADLGVRTASGIVMIVLAVTAFSLGGAVLKVFVGAVALGVLVEAWGLVRRMAPTPVARLLWMIALAAYVGCAAFGLLRIVPGFRWVVVASVIATDIGAYFAGRTFGGPKIAPSISPSKTWAGLFGGMAASALVLLLVWFVLAYALQGLDGDTNQGVDYGALFQAEPMAIALALGMGAAVVAQMGDFFESWLKRRAGVKDSGRMIPGHGGVFDRVDGLLAVCFPIGILYLMRWP